MVETEYSKVKVNNEMDFCSVLDNEFKRELEKAFMKARVSYFLRWEKPSFFAKVFKREKMRVVFCINQAQIEHAENVIKSMGDEAVAQVRFIKTKSNNKMGF